MKKNNSPASLRKTSSALAGKSLDGFFGMNGNQRRKIADGLETLLADTYTLYLQTQNFHWNVTGVHFRSLHLMFESQYQELAASVDEIAERIRAVGYFVPATFQSFSSQATLKEVEGVLSAEEMVGYLLKGQSVVILAIRALYPAVEAACDHATADLLARRLGYHEKTAWMLRSLKLA